MSLSIDHSGSRRRGIRLGLGAVILAAGLLLLGATAPPVTSQGSDPSAATPAAPATVVPVPAYRQATKVAVLTVEGEIDHLTLTSLERRIADAKADGAEAIVLDINTPGGRLDATLDICHLIKTDAPANTVAWINPQAYSAGTIIALACREIVVARNASFGDAAPIQMSPMGLQSLGATERAKAESPILEEVIDSARRRHYDENLVQAFISVGVELWLIENIQSGRRIFVDRGEYQAVFGEEPPQGMTPVAPPMPGATTPSSPIVPWVNRAIPPAEDDAPVDQEAMRQQVEFAQTLPPVRQPLTADDAGRWRLVTQVIASDRLLTVKPAEALYYGLARSIVVNDAQLQAYFGALTIERYDRSWSEHLVRFMTNPLVRGVLIVVFVICLLIEMAAPGVGVFGTAAALALAMIVGAPFLAGMAQWWDILLIVVGLALIFAELFIIPGLGVAGIGGAIALLAGLVGTFITEDITSAAGQGELATGLVTTLTSLFAAGIGVWIISRQMHSLPLLDRLILRTEVGDREAAAPSLLQAMGAPATEGPAAGDTGVAATDLRPAGRGEFDGKLIDVKSVGSFIGEGTPIRVVSADRFVIEVEELEA